MKSSYQVLIEAEGKPRGAGLVFHGRDMAEAAAKHLAAERGCTTRVVENRLGGAHHTRAVEVARYRPPGEGEEGGQLVAPARDPHIRRPAVAGICLALLLGACDVPASIAANLVGQAAIGGGEIAVMAAAKRKTQEPGRLPVPPQFVPPPPPHSTQMPVQDYPGLRYKLPIRFWLL